MLKMLKTVRLAFVLAGYGAAAWRLWNEYGPAKKPGTSTTGTGV